MTGDRLSLDLIARRWSAEADQAGIQASDIADELVSAALAGEFDFGVMPIAKSRSVIADDLINDALGDDFEFGVTNLFEYNPPPLSEFPKHPEPPDARGAPKNFDARLGVMVETFTRDGAPVNAGQLQNYLNTMKSARGATDAEARRILAREIDLSIQGFRLWLDHLEFAEWAQSRRLSRPLFIDEQGAAPTEPSSPQNAASRVGERPGGEDTSPNESILKIPGHSAAALAEYIEWERLSTIYEADGSNKIDAADLVRTELNLSNVEAEYIAKMVREVRRWRKSGIIPE